MKTKLMIMSVMTLLAQGCGNPRPLTPEETTRLQSTLGNIGRAMTVVQAVGTDPSKRTASAAPSLLMGGLSVGAPNSYDKDAEKLAADLEKAIKSGDCKMPKTLPTDLKNKSKGKQDVNFTIEGAKCPVKLSFSISGDVGEKSVNLRYRVSYSVKDRNWLDLTDIDSVDVFGTLNSESNGASNFYTDSMSVNVGMTLEGSIHSRKEGTIKVGLNGQTKLEMAPQAEKVTGASELVVRLEFKDFIGQLKAVAKTDGQNASEERFELNGKELTRSEFQEFLGSLATPIQG